MAGKEKEKDLIQRALNDWKKKTKKKSYKVQSMARYEKESYNVQSMAGLEKDVQKYAANGRKRKR